jgi:hypothetical protein
MHFIKRENNKEKRQLGLELQYSRFELFYKIKRFARKLEKQFTVLPFWRHGTIWVVIMTIVGISGIWILLLQKYYSDLPPEITLIYDVTTNKWRSFPRIYSFVIPVILLVVGFLAINTLWRTYYMNKRLTMMIGFVIILSYILFFIALNQILILNLS